MGKVKDDGGELKSVKDGSMNIKLYLKKSKMNQYRRCLVEYSQKEIRVSGGQLRRAMLNNALKVKPIYMRSEAVGGKAAQLGRVLRKAVIDVSLKNGFLYSIDETCIPYNRNSVIDNMPFDYSYVIDGSISQYKEKYKKIGNRTAEKSVALLQAVEEYIDRICNRLERDKDAFVEEKEIAIRRMRNMKDSRAQTLEDALQRILFWNQILWQCGHTLNGLGRLDKLLDRFELSDTGRQSLFHFLELLHDYYNFKSSAMLGDTGQIIVLGGLEKDGSYFANRYTYLILECSKELKLPDPKLLLRVSQSMPDRLLAISAKCIAEGNGSPLLSNDDIVIPALMEFGYSDVDAYNYGVSACWEPLSIGNSLEQNNVSGIEFGQVLTSVIRAAWFTECKDFEQVLQLYTRFLTDHVGDVCEYIDQINWEPAPLFTLFCPDCIEKDLDISEGGAVYNNYGILSTGLAAAVDSLLNIKRYVFEQKILSLKRIREIVINDYVEEPEYQRLLAQKTDGFGSRSEDAIALTNRIMKESEKALSGYRNRFGGNVKFGLSSPGYINSGKITGATADGRKGGKPFATHISRTSNASPEDIMQFAGGLCYNGRRANGNVVDVVLQPSFVRDDKGRFLDYLKGSICMGFFQAQFNVFSYAQLADAKAHPERYPNLIVRVWGFSAYFKDIPEEYQDVLIRRAKESEGIR